VPERLLQVFLSNYGGDDDNNRSTRLNLIEAEVEEGMAAPINLA